MAARVEITDVRALDGDDYTVVATLVQDSRAATNAEVRLWGSCLVHDRVLMFADRGLRMLVGGRLGFSERGSDDTQRYHRRSLPQPTRKEKNGRPNPWV